MMQVIDLGNECLVDSSRVRNGQLRLLLAAIGRPLVAGSPWTVLDKRIADRYRPLFDSRREQIQRLPAA